MPHTENIPSGRFTRRFRYRFRYRDKSAGILACYLPRVRLIIDVCALGLVHYLCDVAVTAQALRHMPAQKVAPVLEWLE
jgi:hypothetical protein